MGIGESYTLTVLEGGCSYAAVYTGEFDDSARSAIEVVRRRLFPDDSRDPFDPLSAWYDEDYDGDGVDARRIADLDEAIDRLIDRLDPSFDED